MKKTLIIAALSLFAATAFCQAKPDTSKHPSFSVKELDGMTSNLYKAVQTLHKVDMSSVKRDSIDNLIGAVYNFILQRETETYHPKAAVKEGGKKN